MDILNNSIVTDLDTEILDGEIDQISNYLSETHYFDNEQEEELELLIAKAMKLGELYERKKWQAAKAQAVPEGFVLVKKANRIGNPNVDFSQAPRWAKYWLKDGHSNKYWWSSTRPIKDMDLQAFCWRGDYFAEEAPSFNFAGSWDKSLTSKKAMIEAQEPANDSP